MWTRIGLNTLPRRRGRALHSADRLAPRRRHLLPNCLWCPVAVEGFALDQPLSGPSTPCLPQALKSASKPTATRRRCRSSRPRLSGLAASPAAPIACARACRRSRRFACAACSTGAWWAASVSPRSASARPRGRRLLGPLVVDPAVKGKGYGKALVEEGLARARGRRLRARAARRRHALLRPVRLSTGAAGADQLAGAGRSRAAACRSSLFRARLPAPRARSKATRANGLRGTRSRPGSRAEGRARGSR